MTVKTGPRHVVRESEDGTFQMSIKSVLRSDAGVYTCKIVNEYGAKQCEGKLQVKGEVPHGPRDLFGHASTWFVSVYTGLPHASNS